MIEWADPSCKVLVDVVAAAPCSIIFTFALKSVLVIVAVEHLVSVLTCIPELHGNSKLLWCLLLVLLLILLLHLGHVGKTTVVATRSRAEVTCGWVWWHKSSLAVLEHKLLSVLAWVHKLFVLVARVKHVVILAGHWPKVVGVHHHVRGTKVIWGQFKTIVVRCLERLERWRFCIQLKLAELILHSRLILVLVLWGGLDVVALRGEHQMRGLRGILRNTSLKAIGSRVFVLPLLLTTLSPIRNE